MKNNYNCGLGMDMDNPIINGKNIYRGSFVCPTLRVEVTEFIVTLHELTSHC